MEDPVSTLTQDHILLDAYSTAVTSVVERVAPPS